MTSYATARERAGLLLEIAAVRRALGELEAHPRDKAARVEISFRLGALERKIDRLALERAAR
jgi:hypothetical protein